MRDATLPACAGAIRTAAMFAFVVALGEFGATAFLARADRPTVPVAIARLLGQPGAASIGQASALGGDPAGRDRWGRARDRPGPDRLVRANVTSQRLGPEERPSVGMDVQEATGTQPPRWLGPLIGLVTAGVALGVAHLVAGWVNAAASPVITVGEGAIDSSPTWLKDYAIRSFGSDDKRVLLLGIGLVIALAAVAIGNAAVRRPRRVDRPRRPGRDRRPRRPDPPGRHRGRRRARARRRGRRCDRLARAAAPAGLPATTADDPPVASLDRRQFLWTAGVGAVVAIGAGGVGGFLSRRFRADDSRGIRPDLVARVARLRRAGGLRRGRRDLAVLHAKRPLLPGRHRAPRPGGHRRGMAAAGPRDGRARDHAHVRPAPGASADRARHHAHVRLEPGRRTLPRQRPLDRRAAAGSPSARPGSNPGPISWSGARSMGSRSGRPHGGVG